MLKTAQFESKIAQKKSYINTMQLWSKNVQQMSAIRAMNCLKFFELEMCPKNHRIWDSQCPKNPMSLENAQKIPDSCQ